MKITIKLIISLLLIGCVAHMPYGYYQFIRIAGCAGFAYLAYIEFEENKVITGILCVAAAILLNPIFKIHFERKLWNEIDIVLAAALILWLIIDLYLQDGKSSKKG
jgi:hypothetical protein